MFASNLLLCYSGRWLNWPFFKQSTFIHFNGFSVKCIILCKKYKCIFSEFLKKLSIKGWDLENVAAILAAAHCIYSTKFTPNYFFLLQQLLCLMWCQYYRFYEVYTWCDASIIDSTKFMLPDVMPVLYILRSLCCLIWCQYYILYEVLMPDVMPLFYKIFP